MPWPGPPDQRLSMPGGKCLLLQRRCRPCRLVLLWVSVSSLSPLPFGGYGSILTKISIRIIQIKAMTICINLSPGYLEPTKKVHHPIFHAKISLVLMDIVFPFGFRLFGYGHIYFMTFAGGGGGALITGSLNVSPKIATNILRAIPSL